MNDLTPPTWTTQPGASRPRHTPAPQVSRPPARQWLALDPRGFGLVVGVRGRVGPGPWVAGFFLGWILGAVLELDEGHADL